MASEEEHRNKMADAVYFDLLDCGRLKRDPDFDGYLFPYGGEVYRTAKTYGSPAGTWAVQRIGSPELVANGSRTRRASIRETVMALQGTQCAAGYHIGQDSCPHCDAKTEEFENQHP